MPSIQATAYTVSAMVPSVLPSPAANTPAKPSAEKTVTVSATDATHQVSDRVTAFVAIEPATKTAAERPAGPPPPGGGMVRVGAGAAGRNEAASESETALMLLEADQDEDAASDVTAEDSAVFMSPIRFDSDKTYYPTSIY